MLSDIGEWRASLDGLSFQKMNEYEVASLERPFIVEEEFTAPSDLIQIDSRLLSGSLVGKW